MRSWILLVLTVILLTSLVRASVGRVDVGIKALKDGFYDVAIEEFRMSLKEKKDPAVEFLLGLAYLKKGDNGMAYRIFSRLIDSGCKIQKLPMYWSLSAFGFSLDLVAQGMEKKAVPILEKLLKFGGDRSTVQKARYILGGIYYKEKKYSDVVRVLSPLEGSLDPYGMFVLSESYFGLGDVRSSVRILKDMIRKGVGRGKDRVLSILVKRGSCKDILDLVDLTDCLSFKPFFMKALYCAIASGSDGLVGRLEGFSRERGLFKCETAYAVSSYLFSKGRFDEVLKELSFLSGCDLPADRRAKVAFMKGFSLYKKGDLDGACKAIVPVYFMLRGEMKRNSSFILYSFFKGKGSVKAVGYLKDLLSMSRPNPCDLLEDGIAFLHGKGLYGDVVSLYETYSKGCTLDDKTFYFIGDSYLYLGNKKGLSILSRIKDPGVRDLAELKRVIFFCKKGPSQNCIRACRSSLSRVRNPAIRSKIRALLSLE